MLHDTEPTQTLPYPYPALLSTLRSGPQETETALHIRFATSPHQHLGLFRHQSKDARSARHVLV
jgi:hypothetical protein